MNPKLILLALVLLSLILFIRLFSYFQGVMHYPEETQITFETKLSNQPQMSSLGQRVSLILPNSQKVSVQFSLSPVLSYGDKIRVEGKVQYFKAKDGDLVAFMNYPKLVLVEKGTESNLMLKVRESIINFFNSSLPPKYASLMLGITFGIREEMDSQFYLDLQKTGLLHVVAASGMNITMVGGFLLGLFGLFLRRQLALMLTILGILFYALMAGLEPSIVRAGIMGILVFSAQILGRQSASFLALFGAGFLMLFLQPSLLFDIGFQLSFMATFGLIYLRPIFFLSKRLKRIIEKSVIGEDFATTITAQLSTLPILLSNFGTYSLASILTNAVVLWTVPILMIIGGLAAILGLIFLPFGKLALYLSIPFLIYFDISVGLFSLKSPQISILNFPQIMALGYYLILLSIIMFIKAKK